MRREADNNELRRNSIGSNKKENELSSFNSDSPAKSWEGSQMLQGLQKKNRSRWGCKLSCIPIILTVISLVLLFLLLIQSDDKLKLTPREDDYEDNCQISIAESIPEGLIYPKHSAKFPSTYDTWMQLIELANHSIDIASFYWTLRLNEVHPHRSSQQGEDIYQAIRQGAIQRHLKIRIAQNAPDEKFGPNNDTDSLMKEHAAEIQNLNFSKIFNGGILHTKFWIIDRRHIYIGSANMDWRSLTQVKEMGLVAYNCSCLADDVSKIFDVYWLIGKNNSTLPYIWPATLSTKFNMQTPMRTIFNGLPYEIFISSSPSPLSTVGRSNDIDSILNIISLAEEFIYVAVMDYYPIRMYAPAQKFWPVIDNALRAAAFERNVKIYLLISWWTHSNPSEDFFLKSLADLSGIRTNNRSVDIQVKRFVIPSSPEQAEIPFARVNHNKYMVTDNSAYVGTSNWSGDYFIDTAGVGFIIRDKSKTKRIVHSTLSSRPKESLRKQMQTVFERDWNSVYAKPMI